MSTKAAPVVTGQGVGDNNRHISNAVASAEGVPGRPNTSRRRDGRQLHSGGKPAHRQRNGRKAISWGARPRVAGAAGPRRRFAVLYEVSGYNTKTSIRLYNNSGANTTVDLWFF